VSITSIVPNFEFPTPERTIRSQTYVPAVSRRGSGRVASIWVEREIDDELVEPDDRALPLAIFLEEDDAQLSESAEFLVDVLHVPVNDPCGFVDAGWLFPADGFDEIKHARRRCSIRSS